jgi:hypothetical protein
MVSPDLQAELTSTPERTEALLTAMCLPPHMLDIMKAGLGLQGQVTTIQLLEYPFAQPTFFSEQHFSMLQFLETMRPCNWQQHVASYLVARPPVLQQRLEVVKGDLGECG